MTDETPRQQNGKAVQKGKRPKRFLEQNDALSLAASIGETQEKIALTKAEKHHKLEPDQPKPDHKPKPNANAKAKIKEKKKVLSSARVKAKKERSKRRKEQFKNTKASSNPTPEASEVSEKPARKKVAFA
ncbi:hypothetical protein BDN70DRAFT_975103 [Pholiota conissans]|uniref:Uncharacterized protein n=1 Tax=Pholiota conissans TaxID=109636 RepID=A0A9P5Z8C3_9AGAR|nr:hypothetical protein BDN70DRAFT_975103 [Pholiota conissans]